MIIFIDELGCCGIKDLVGFWVFLICGYMIIYRFFFFCLLGVIGLFFVLVCWVGFIFFLEVWFFIKYLVYFF